MKSRVKLIGIIALVAVMAFALVFTTCSDDSGDDDDNSNNNDNGNNNGGTATVYVMGGYWDSNGNETVCYWKDGTITNLSLPPGTRNAVEATTGIAIQGNNVYVSGGYINSNGYRTACYWVNGTRTDLSVPDEIKDFFDTTETTGIAVQGNNVYVSGLIDDGLPCYWVNGTCYWANETETGPYLSLPDRFEYAEATGIAIQGNNVYVSGYYVDSNGNETGCYWKDRTRTDLSVPPGYHGSAIGGIAVQGNNVYLYGVYWDFNYNNRIFCYWVNGTRTDLSGNSGEVCDIAVQGNNVYLSGVYWDGYDVKACYWINGTRTDLSKPSNTQLFELDIKIAVYDGKVYVNGAYCDSNDQNIIPCYWVDGIRTDLPVPAGAIGAATTGIAVVAQ